MAAIDIGPNERKVVWQDQLATITASAYRDGRYYAAALSGDVFSYDAGNGKRVWRSQTGAPISSITTGEASLYLAGTNGRISTVDISNGEIIWHDDIGGDVASRPFVFEDGIYFSTGLKNIYGYKF